MTRKELVDAVADTCHLPTKEVTAVIDTTINAIKAELTVGNEVDLIGFGKFSVKHRNAREGTNPRTGKPIDIPARKVPYFQAGRALKEAVRQC